MSFLFQLSDEYFGGGGGGDRVGGNLHRPPLPRRDDSHHSESTESWEFRSATLEVRPVLCLLLRKVVECISNTMQACSSK